MLRGRATSSRGPMIPKMPDVSETGYKVVNRALLDHQEKIRRDCVNLLNKMTLERFQHLVAQFGQMGVHDCEDLEIIIRLVFEKAVAEHNFCQMYADLCVQLRTMFPEFSGPAGEKISFTRNLLNICQTEFENLPSSLEMAAEEKEGKTEEDIDILEKKRKDRVLGNMKFIGQLFLRRLLSHKVVTSVVEQLLYSQDRPEDHFVECLVMLLKNIGATLETSGSGKIYLDQFVETLQELKQKNIYAKRIQFLIQDLIDLRTNSWDERLVQDAPKTKQEIREQFMREQANSRGSMMGMSSQHSFGRQQSSVSWTSNSGQQMPSMQGGASGRQLNRTQSTMSAATTRGSAMQGPVGTNLDAKLKSDVDLRVGYYADDHDVEELIKSWDELKLSTSVTTEVVFHMASIGFTNPKKARNYAEALSWAVIYGKVQYRSVIDALHPLMQSEYEDLIIDNPKAAKFFGCLVGNLLLKKGQFEFETNLLQCIPSGSKAKDQLAIDLLVEILHFVRAERGLGLDSLQNVIRKITPPLSKRMLKMTKIVCTHFIFFIILSSS